MALTYEQQSLMNQINQRVAEIQDAIKRALPGNKGLHDDFKVGTPTPSTPAEAVKLGREVEPLARENRSLLIGRGVDAGKVAHLAAMIGNLERLNAAQPAAPESAPAPVAAPAEDAPGEDAPKKGKKKKA